MVTRQSRRSKRGPIGESVSTFADFDGAETTERDSDLYDLDGVAGVDLPDDADVVRNITSGRDRALDPWRL